MWKVDEQKVDEQMARFLKITSFGKDGFTYYSFDMGGDWNIVGFRFFADERIAVRLMRIDNQFLDDESFAAELHGGPYFYCNVLGCKQFLLFAERIILQKEAKNRKRRHYFEMLNASDLQELHYPETWDGVGRWHRYTEKTASQEEEKMSLICLPRWFEKYGIHQGSSFKFITINKSLLEKNPLILTRGNHGLGTMLLSKDALEEVVYMIRETLREIE